MHHEAAVPTISPVAPSTVTSSARYRAKIDAVSPASRRDTFERHEECFLGISLENSNFVRSKLSGIVEWIARRFARCTVLVGDSIHRITLETTRGLAPDAALAEGLRLGRDFTARERDVFDGFADRTQFSFLTCGEVQTTAAYAAYHGRLVELCRTDDRFRASVESFGRKYHAKHSTGISEAELEQRVQRSSDYFLEEFAIFACLRQQGTQVMVYPGSFSTLTEIADGQHPAAPQELRDLVVVSLHLRGR
jgi:tRNA-dependent cyclodipeptide synthase